MVKFIATDLDGTLLDGERRLPEEIFPLIAKLKELGVLFAPASGRQYANLKKLFEPVADDVLFICENGALIKYRGKTLHCHPIGNRYLKEALDEIRALPHLYPMLCGTEYAYIENSEMPFFKYAMLSYTNCKKVPDLDDTFDYQIPEGTQSGTTFTIRGKGIRSRSGTGNLYLRVTVEVPTRLTRDQKKKIADAAETLDIRQYDKAKKYADNVSALYGKNPY